ncbi:MAG: hypothetical protein ACI8TQ_003883 [Planctomycetota bacterium]|jgi:hypothetical protein
MHHFPRLQFLVRTLALMLAISSSTAQSAYPTDAELADAKWIEGRIFLPKNTPAFERIELFADGTPFRSGGLHSIEVPENGRFRIAFSHATDIGNLRLSARFLHLDIVSINLSVPGKPLNLYPKLGARVVGKLIPPPGVPAEQFIGTEVAITIWSKKASAPRLKLRAYAGSELEFKFNGVPAPCDVDISIHVDGYPRITAEIQNVRRGRNHRSEIQLINGCTVRGFILDEDDEPIVDALYWRGQTRVRDDLSAPFARTDETGAFELTTLTPGAINIAAYKLGRVPSSIEVSLADAEVREGIKLVVPIGLSLEGVVFDEDGKPAPQIWVKLERIEQGEGQHQDCPYPGKLSLNIRDGVTKFKHRYTLTAAQTDQLGRFEFSGLTSEPLTIWLSESKESNAPRTLVRTRVTAAASPFEFVYVPTQGTGPVAIDDLTPESSPLDLFEAFVGKPAIELLDSIETPSPLEGLWRPRLTGRVVNPNGEGLGDVLVRVEDLRADDSEFFRSSRQATRTDADGNYSFQIPFEGPVQLIAQHKAFAREMRAIRAESWSTVETSFELAKGGSLDGVVKLADGSPATGYTVYAFPATSEAVKDRRVKPDGTFKMGNLSPGSWTAFVDSPDGDEVFAATSFEVRSGVQSKVDLQVGKGPIHLTGIVNVGLNTLDGAQIVFTRLDLDVTFSTTIQRGGDYAIELPSSGWYAIQIELDEFYLSFVRHVEASINVKLNLGIATGSIEGHVYKPNGEPADDVELLASPPLETDPTVIIAIVNTTTDSNGFYRFQGLPSNTYRVATGQHFDYIGEYRTSFGSASMSGLQVTPGERLVDVDFNLPGSLPIDGVVRDERGGVPHALIFARIGNTLLSHDPITTTDDSGRFTIKNMSPGAELFALTRYEASPGVIVESAADLELRLTPATLLRVHGLDSSGTLGMFGFRVTDLSGKEYVERSDYLWHTGADETVFGPLPPGSYRIDGSSYLGNHAFVEIEVSGEVERQIQLHFESPLDD